MKITQEVRALAMEQAGRRCECTGENCRHHLRGARCKRGLRGDDWKVFWRSEKGGATRENIEAWCHECFANNFEVPRESVALLALDIVGYAELVDESRRRAITLKSVLRDAIERAAGSCRGRMVLDRLDDDVLVEFPTSRDAVKAVQSLSSNFHEIAERLDLDVPHLSGAIHYGEVTRWRNGFLVGDAVDLMKSVRALAGCGQVVLTEPAVAPVRGKVELEPIETTAGEQGDVLEGATWAMRL